MYHRIFYESKIKGRFGPVALLSMQKKSARRNLDAGITSFLYYDKTRIFQVLEGEQAAVDETLTRITANKLHTDVKIRAILRCDARKFEHWAFGATHMADADFKRVMIASQQSDFFSLDVLQAERFLSIVASRKRRSMKSGGLAAKVLQFKGANAEDLASSDHAQSTITRSSVFAKLRGRKTDPNRRATGKVHLPMVQMPRSVEQ